MIGLCSGHLKCLFRVSSIVNPHKEAAKCKSCVFVTVCCLDVLVMFQACAREFVVEREVLEIEVERG
jgi:hypothetical protein